MKREAKIGLFAVLMIGAAWAGIRFLSGIDIFSRNRVYYAVYDRIDGVQSASPVMMRGVKIGTVTGVSFDPARSGSVVLQFTIKRQYRIPTDSEAKIFSDGFLGNKAIEITYGTASSYLEKGDTLRSGRNLGLMDMAGSELEFFKQKFSQVVGDLSRTLGTINTLLEDNTSEISGTLSNLNALTGDMRCLLAAERGNLESAVENLAVFSQTLGANAGRVDSIVGNLDRLSAQLSDERFVGNLTHAVEGLDALIARINAGEGTLGRLATDDALYASLNEASANLSALLADLKQYPGRYVHLSVFGRDPEKMKEKADRRAAKAAARAERDSLRRAE